MPAAVHAPSRHVGPDGHTKVGLLKFYTVLLQLISSPCLRRYSIDKDIEGVLYWDVTIEDIEKVALLHQFIFSLINCY